MKYLGVDYYPEQWGIELIDEDLANIKELGCNVIRVADFAWDIFEPQDGVYSFDFFDEVLRKANEYGLKVIMCIPTATMPAWLYEKYPQIMNEDERGYRQPYGARRGYCYNSSIYKEKARSLTRALLTHYKGHPDIVAWQMDNEIGHEGSDMCYCDACRDSFHRYLEEKYKNIEDLNYRWGTHFWSHTYQTFKQIPLPRKAFVAQNPSLRLEWERFRSASIVSFIRDMYETIKSIDPEVTVIHDFEGGTDNKHFDPFEVARYTDVAAYNNYPVWGGQPEAMKDDQLAYTLDFARGLKGQNFWVTEAIMGAQGHDIIGKAPKPLEAIKWSKMAIEHGAESNIFFRYRGYNKGAEQFCFGILDADNEKRRRYEETKQFFSEVRDILPPQREKEVCIVWDYDSASAFKIQRQSDAFDYNTELFKLYREFYKRGMAVDIVDKNAELRSYRFIVIPSMIVMSDAFKQKLKKAVADGASAIVTFRSAWKDLDNNLPFRKRLPYDLDDLTGCVIEEHEALLNGQFLHVDYQGKEGLCYVFEECLTLRKGATAVVRYKDSQFGDYPAVTFNRFEKGCCYYFGTSLEENLLSMVFDEITEKGKE